MLSQCELDSAKTARLWGLRGSGEHGIVDLRGFVKTKPVIMHGRGRIRVFDATVVGALGRK
jgi:hypothetical protein